MTSPGRVPTTLKASLLTLALLCTFVPSHGQPTYTQIDLTGELRQAVQTCLADVGPSFTHPHSSGQPVPFRFQTTAQSISMWGGTDPVLALSITVPAGQRVSEVFTVANTFWGNTNPAFNPTIVFIGSNGAQHSFQYLGDVSLRDYNGYGSWTHNLDPTVAENIYSCNGQRLDVQRIVLPAAFLTEDLAQILITDRGGYQISRMILAAITLKTVPPPPTSGTTGSTSSGSTGSVSSGTTGTTSTGTTGTTSSGTTGTTSTGTTSTGTTGTTSTGTTSTGTTGTTSSGSTSTGTTSTGTTGTTSTGSTSTGTTSTGTTGTTGVPPPRCPARPAPDHGSASTTDESAVGTTVTYSCDAGYRLEYDNRDDDRDDDDDDDDDRADDDDDDDDRHDDDRRKRGSDRNGNDDDDDDDDERSKRCVCLRPRRRGSSQGVWSCAVPRCVPIKDYCRSRSAPSNGRQSPNGGGGHPIGTTVTYTCDAGYTRDGSATATCGVGGTLPGTGVWSAAVPSCRPTTGGSSGPCTRSGGSSSRTWNCPTCSSLDVRCYDSRTMKSCDRRSKTSSTYDCSCTTGYSPVCLQRSGYGNAEEGGEAAAAVDQPAQSNAGEDLLAGDNVFFLAAAVAGVLLAAVGVAAVVAYGRKRRGRAKIAPLPWNPAVDKSPVRSGSPMPDDLKPGKAAKAELGDH